MLRPPSNPETMTRDQAKTLVLRILTQRLRRHGGTGVPPVAPPRPVPAAALARWLNAWPHQARESQRRRVRELVKEMQAAGTPIVAVHSASGGYYLAELPRDFITHATDRRRSGLTDMAAGSRTLHSVGLAEAAGQLPLFGDTGVPPVNQFAPG